MRPIDFRCGHDGLAAKVQEMLRLDPFSGAAFVFRSKRADDLKAQIAAESLEPGAMSQMSPAAMVSAPAGA